MVLVLTGCQAVGSIAVVAGTGVEGTTGDGGPAVNAEIAEPEAVAAIPGGGFYIADHLACVIRKVDATGVISTVAGNGTCGYTGDGGPATAAEIRPTLRQGIVVQSDGSLLFSGYVDTSGSGSGVVRKVASDGTISTVFGPTAHSLIGFTGSPGGTTYVVDAYPGQMTTITAVAPDGTSSIVYTGSPVLMTVAYLGSRQLAVDQYSPTASGTIDRLDLATGTLTSTGFTSAGAPPGLAAASDGTIYATENDSVVRITPDNTVTTVAGGGTGDPLKGGSATGVHLQPRGLALAPDDGLLISSSYPGSAVYRLQLPPHSS
jgi:hypothetical protein